ncbi:helix-turn-helix domain-containing protein [Leucobacter albus]|uniref:Helix-turn-helix domain-containing protein n=1 Tax=Leucobacter albus TaxID=272210 RepID=A0ABW3TS49_9MICO
MPHASAPRQISDREISEFSSADLHREGTRSRDALAMDAVVHALGPLFVIEASGGPTDIERRPLLPGMPTIDFVFVEYGTFTYLEDGVWIESNDPLLVAPSGLPLRVRFLTPWKFLVARIQRDVLLPFLPRLPEGATVYAGLTLPERAMRGYLQGVTAKPEKATPGEAATVSRVTIEMAGALLRQRFPLLSAQPPKGAANVWGDAMAVIARESGRPGFGTGELAAEVGCSVRQLQLAFSRHETSVAAELRRERGRIARSTLQNPEHDALTVAEVAAMSGFGSTSTMYRALLDLYGVTQQELRRRGSPVGP